MCVLTGMLKIFVIERPVRQDMVHFLEPRIFTGASARLTPSVKTSIKLELVFAEHSMYLTAPTFLHSLCPSSGSIWCFFLTFRQHIGPSLPKDLATADQWSSRRARPILTRQYRERISLDLSA